jgi:hypothetical protein
MRLQRICEMLGSEKRLEVCSVGPISSILVEESERQHSDLEVLHFSTSITDGVAIAISSAQERRHCTIPRNSRFVYPNKTSFDSHLFILPFGYLVQNIMNLAGGLILLRLLHRRLRAPVAGTS